MKILLIILSIISIYTNKSVSTAKSDAFYLEEKFTFGLNVNLYIKNNQEYLHVSGLSGHSSYAIKNIIIKNHHGTLVIYAELTPVSKKYSSGNFSIELKLNKKIKKVAIGSVQDVIWKR